MARCKRCMVKRRKEEGKRRKKDEKEEEIGDQIAKKKRSLCASFSFAQSSFFLSIRNTLFREKHTISAFVFTQDFFDEQIKS